MIPARFFACVLCAAALAAGLAAAPVAAQTGGDHHPEETAAVTPAERLDRLFATLADPAASDARLVERRIAEIWSASGSDSMNFLLQRGRDAMETEEYEKAIEHLTALTRLAPDFAEGWNARATAHFLAREYWWAVADIQQALMLEPRHFGALAGLGSILERTGDETGALVAWREALRLNPHLAAAREAVGRLERKVDGRDI